MNKYISRLTSSARGERFNPLTYPFFIATLLYGIGFLAFSWTSGVKTTALLVGMANLAPWVPFIWGAAAVLTIIGGIAYLTTGYPQAGKLSGLAGFMVWLFAFFVWLDGGAWLLAFSVGLPNMYFWAWQFLSLRLFRAEDREDKATMEAYDRGEYDDELNPKDSKVAREDNRGVDEGDQFK